MRKLLVGVVLIALGCLVWRHIAKKDNPRSIFADSRPIPGVICGVQIPGYAELSPSLVQVKGWLEEPEHVAVTGSVFKTRRCTYNMKNHQVNGVQLRRVFDCGESPEEQKRAYAEVMRGIDSLVDGVTVLSDDKRSSEWGVSREICCCGNLRIYAYLHREKDEDLPVLGLTVSVPYE